MVIINRVKNSAVAVLTLLNWIVRLEQSPLTHGSIYLLKSPLTITELSSAMIRATVKKRSICGAFQFIE